jgi:hypothetical protein
MEDLTGCWDDSCVSAKEKVELSLVCGCCNLSFECGGSAPLGHLIIKFKNGRMFKHSDTELLLSSLERVLNARTNFAVTYDFRKGHPSPKLAMSIGSFIYEHRESWQRFAMTMALLIAGNIFVACARGVIGSFIKMWLPGCPAIVCHCDKIAGEFFMANTTSSTIEHEFVSVVNVQEHLPGARVEGSRHCLAFLAPLLPWNSSKIGSALHVLPNGDVRVIQSLADNDLMCSTSDKAAHTIGDTPSALPALKFEGSQQDLEQLIGAHFHIGELIADADIESRNLKLAKHSFRREDRVTGCWDAALLKMVQICATSLSSAGGQKAPPRRANKLRCP